MVEVFINSSILPPLCPPTEHTKKENEARSRFDEKLDPRCANGSFQEKKLMVRGTC